MIKRPAAWLLIVTLCAACGHMVAQSPQDSSLPAPTGNPHQLFYLQRTPDANTVVYELNYLNGTLNTLEPIHAFWIRYSENGQRTELNALQKKFAYGIKAKPIAADVFQLQFVANRSLVMYLRKGADDKYYVYATINQKQVMLKRIFLQINGGSFWAPKIAYAELSGIDPDAGITVRERIRVND
ncbi:MAG TPA: DUF4833 domain-containing protein [Chitinophagaceae bacterium]|nr:DUF4833 domain-containing protein [Chitinophagaceae bacterium]